MSNTSLFDVNVNEHVEKKGKFNYLSWAHAWKVFVEHHPSAVYEVIKDANGLPYFESNAGAMVFTRVNVEGITHEMWLPVMDTKNQAITKDKVNMMDVNKAIMRCLVKNLAMFGLGLYIYAGEDLPDEPPEQLPPALAQADLEAFAGVDFSDEASLKSAYIPLYRRGKANNQTEQLATLKEISDLHKQNLGTAQ